LKLLLFSPFAGILPHIRLDLLLAQGLRSMGHEIIQFQCDGLYSSFCITMSAHGLTEASDPALKAERCRECKRMRDSNNAKRGLPREFIDAGFQPDDAAEVERLMAGVTPENFAAFERHGMPVGRIASYEFLINHKKNNLDFSAADFAAYRIALRNTLATQISMERAVAKHRPDRIIMMDTAYSVNGMVRAIGDREGIPVYDFFPGINIADKWSKLNLARHNTISNFNHLKTEVWTRVKDRPIPKEIARYVVSHFQSLFAATDIFVYSSPRDRAKADLRSRFGIHPGQKIIVAALSSFDERFAGSVIGRIPSGRESLFPSQASWCEALIEWFRDHPEYFLIIRTHPREFPNKREGVKSAHVEKLREIFKDLPPNVAVNWPNDNISIYNIGEEADVFLSAWSNAGIEMSLFGLPVVVYSDDLILYPSDLNFLGKTRDEYFAKVAQAVDHGWDFEKIRMAFRWYAVQFRLACVDVDRKDFPAASFLEKGLRFLGRKSGLAAFLNLADRLHLDGARLSENALRQIEDTLAQTRESLSDAEPKPAGASMDPEEETDGILAAMEILFEGFPGRIQGNLRAYAAARKKA